MPNRLIGETFLPFEPMFRASRCETIGQFAEHVGIARTNVAYYQKNGILLRTAEKWAIKFGLHPIEVWGEQYEHAAHHLAMWQDIKEARQRMARLDYKRRVRS